MLLTKYVFFNRIANLRTKDMMQLKSMDLQISYKFKKCLSLLLSNGKYSQVFSIFHKFTLLHFMFMKDLHQYLFQLTKRNLRRIFIFMEKGENENIIHLFVLQQAVIEAVHPVHPETTWRKQSCQASSPGPTSAAPQHQGTLSLELCL